MQDLRSDYAKRTGATVEAIPFVTCTACGKVDDVNHMDLGESFAACSDECLMKIHDES